MHGFVVAAIVASMAVRGSAHAKGARIEPSKLDGSYAFEWTRAKRGCEKLDAKLQKQLAASFVCTTVDPDDVGTASGKPLAAKCAARKGRAEYLVFTSAVDCKEEREAQAANGE